MSTSDTNPTQPLFEISPGDPHPLGATVKPDGVNFSLFSHSADRVQLLLFDEAHDDEPDQIIELDPEVNKSFFFWHVFVKGLKPGYHYAYRVDGPDNILEGHRFNFNKVLIDPYALGNNDHLWDRVAACGPEDNLDKSMRSVVIDPDQYDWEGDKQLNTPIEDLVIYETHVGGFTKHASAKAKNPGTFKGIIEKIPYLKELGINAIEFLPVFEFDDTEVLRVLDDGTVLQNYWGYSTVGFFAPDNAYCVTPEEGSHLDEFRDMVKALHKAGIEVILDVVFNHTNEGNHMGPTISFRGIDNKTYYHLVVGNAQYYMDYSGCGNTVNCNHPVVRKFIVDALKFWVTEMHVDGFRFDEGSILSRGEKGQVLEHAPVLWDLELNDEFADTKLIAEAWDAAGLYQIGCFPGYRWSEWNGKYRDDVRKFVKGDAGMIGAIASRIAGSADIYEGSGHQPSNSINFVNCHDGFTLYDLVAYNGKHNWANGENNNDGVNDNDSWNCGWEGETDDPGINALRKRQIKNFCAILLLSRGVPMFVAGDELCRTQQGNNNAYCQDNEISWINWDFAEKNKEILRFFQNMIAFRKANKVLRKGEFYGGRTNDRGLPEISWHGCQLNAPGWDDPSAQALSFTLAGFNGDPDLHVILNMSYVDLDFELPDIEGFKWARVVDTSLESPDDFAEPGTEIGIDGNDYHANGRSVVILVSKKG